MPPSGGAGIPRGPAIYSSASRTLPVLEVLARVRRPEDSADFVEISATFDEDAGAAPDALPGGWRLLPASESTQRLGAAWAADPHSPVLRLPSVVLPAESDDVLSPPHPDAASGAIGDPGPLGADPRLS